MSIEEQLRELILSKYASIRAFSIAIDMPYSTLDSIFKRGVENASVSNIIRICNALTISADALAEGTIASKFNTKDEPEQDADERELLRIYRSANAEGRANIINIARLVAGNPAMLKDGSVGEAIS